MKKAKNPVLLILFFVLIAAFYNFKVNNHVVASPKEKYCGFEMSEDEVVDVKTRGIGYKYSHNDMEIQSEIADIAQKVGGDSIIIEVFFFLSNENELGIYLFGPNDPKLIEKMDCAIINAKYKNKVPSKKYILYYETDKEPLLAGIKSQM